MTEREIKARAEQAVRGFSGALTRLRDATPGTEQFVRTTKDLAEFFHEAVTELVSLADHERKRREQAEQELQEYVEGNLEAIK